MPPRSISTESGKWKEQRAQVERFIHRFGESYRSLLRCAALPLVLTPELVNYLRTDFLRTEGVPWEAEVDLLLSDLCDPVGHELYAMDAQVRAYLLEEIATDSEWQGRMRQVAQVLLTYVKMLSRVHPQQRQQELVAQRLAAMTFMGDEKCREAARELAERLQQVGQLSPLGADGERGIRAQLVQLAKLTQELSPQLQESQGLVNYARVLGQVLRAPESVTPMELADSYREQGVELGFDERWLPDVARQNLQRAIASAVGEREARLVSFPLEVETAQLVAGSAFPVFQEEEFTVATLVPKTVGPRLEPFEFETATLTQQQRQGGLGGLLNRQQQTEWEIQRRQGRANRFRELLVEGVELEMVSIPGGTFLMGSPRSEKERESDEGPQHQVTVGEFSMGRYPVTQAQWRTVVAMEQVNRALEPDPSRFKGNDRPVENVSWEDAKEFCDRLSAHTQRTYRLPSEAEWEYACRAGTTTPFYFGKTLTDELANYRATSNYDGGPEGQNRHGTTPVGSFPANAFGLSDMHGNVWEWCEDFYHESYRGAPTSGKAWLTRSEKQLRIQRGGSWLDLPWDCRSARRYRLDPSYRDSYCGFRVVCAAPRT